MKYNSRMTKINSSNLITKKPEILVLDAENNFDSKLTTLCKMIIQNEKNIILLTGPSSSGKTTTAKKLVNLLEGLGKNANRVSLDNFYKAQDDMPLWEDGQKNYEIIDSLDLEHFDMVMGSLSKDKTAHFPVYDFHHKVRADKTIEVSMHDHNSYLVLEGIHALNPELSKNIDEDKIFRVYVSVHSDFVAPNGDIILAAKDLRLIRRALRDSVHRKTAIEDTLNMWEYVRKGEALYIHPFRDNADYHINTTHYFEPGLYNQLFTQTLEQAKENSEYADTIERLINGISHFPTMGREMIPPTSLIQEFIKLK